MGVCAGPTRGKRGGRVPCRSTLAVPRSAGHRASLGLQGRVARPAQPRSPSAPYSCALGETEPDPALGTTPRTPPSGRRPGAAGARTPKTQTPARGVGGARHPGPLGRSACRGPISAPFLCASLLPATARRRRTHCFSNRGALRFGPSRPVELRAGAVRCWMFANRSAWLLRRGADPGPEGPPSGRR